MSAPHWIAAFVVLGGAIVAAGGQTPVTTPKTPDHATSTLDDQTELAVTVYNADLALVRDVRNIDIARGVNDLRFMDIAATVNPATVHFRSLTEPGRVRVLEQNYEYDLLEPDKLLRKYVGRDVTLVRTRQEGGTTREEVVTAHLLSYNQQPVWRIGNEIVTGLSADSMRFPEVPSTLFTRPTLIWTLENAGAAKHRVEASYLARQLSWNADYVLTVARDDAQADIDAWVTVVNKSGTAFTNATLQLVAGDVNIVKQAMTRTLGMQRMVAEAAAAPPMTEEAFSDYHLYTLARKTTVNNNQTKQVSMFTGTGVPMKKRYVVSGQQFYYHNQHTPGAPLKDNVEVYYQFTNDEKAGLGVPMPAGVVRVYQQDSRGGVQFVGEDRISHTPKNEILNVKIGNAFDVVCERKQTDFEKISSNVYEIGFEITLRNRKTTPITVEVNEPVGGTWKMLTSTHEATKTSAWAAQFNVAVGADATSVLKYRVRVTY